MSGGTLTGNNIVVEKELQQEEILDSELVEPESVPSESVSSGPTISEADADRTASGHKSAGQIVGGHYKIISKIGAGGVGASTRLATYFLIV
jgi:hypothetical protein